MSDFNRGFSRTIPADRADMSVDAGLRSFMLGVYNKVGLGLVLSAAMAYLTSAVPAVQELLFRVTPDGRLAGYTILGMGVVFAPLLVLLVSGAAVRNPTARSASAIYWTIVALIGASMGALAFRYTGASLATTFMATAAAFGALSLWGYTTKRDLTAFGSFLMVGLVGIVLASLVNIFLHSGPMAMIISILGVFIFAGLIAYDTQKLKMTYYQLGGDAQAMGVATSYGALSLYLDFINLFYMLLNLFGSRR
jgi:FtsH-binding integral membrane protein